MIEGYRKEWKDEELPFFYVQLPNFAIDIYDSDADETGQGWPAVRELQRQALKIPGTGMAVAIDIGEDNDLHPLNKKDIGGRLAMLAAKKLYGIKTECEGPQVREIVTENNTQGCKAEVVCGNVSSGMYVCGSKKGEILVDFELRDEKGAWLPAKAELMEDKVCLWNDTMAGKPTGVRYCYANTNKGGLIYNGAGFPMSPFRIEL